MRIFLTSILSETNISKYKLSFAACNFSSNLINGKIFDKVYSTLPLYVKGNLDISAYNDPRYELIYDKLRVKGGIWRILATIKEQWLIYKKIPNNTSVWMYNLNTINFFIYILLKLFKPSVKRNIIILDFTPAKNIINLNYWFLKLINNADGRICLSTSDLFTIKNCKCLPGVVPASDVIHPKIEQVTTDFLISGMLNDNISMLYSLLIPAFKRLTNCTLHITGVTDEKKLKKAIGSSSNIYYYGQLSKKEYFEIMHKVSFVLSTRNPHAPENECNFPSKIIESLLHNRIVVSTIHYKQLNGINYLEVPHNINNFVCALSEIIQKSNNELLKYANQSEIVKNTFSTQKWNETIEKIEHAE